MSDALDLGATGDVLGDAIQGLGEIVWVEDRLPDEARLRVRNHEIDRSEGDQPVGLLGDLGEHAGQVGGSGELRRDVGDHPPRSWSWLLGLDFCGRLRATTGLEGQDLHRLAVLQDLELIGIDVEDRLAIRVESDQVDSNRGHIELGSEGGLLLGAHLGGRTDERGNERKGNHRPDQRARWTAGLPDARRGIHPG